MAKQKTKGGIAAVVLLSFLWCILTFVLSLLLVVNVTLHQYADNDGLEESVASLDLTEIAFDDGSGTVTLAEFIAEEFVPEDEEADIKGIEDVLKDKRITDFASDIAEDYEDYLLEGGSFPQLKSESIMKLMEDMEEDIYEATKLRVGNGDMDALEADLDATLGDVNDILEGVMAKGLTGFGVRAMFSLWLIIVLGVLLVLILTWMIVVHTSKGFCAGTAMKTFSITAFIACILLLAAALLHGIALEWANAECLKALAQPLANVLLLYSGIGAGVCALLFLIGLIICKIAGKHKLQPVAEVPEMPAPAAETPIAETPAPVEEPAPAPAPAEESAPVEDPAPAAKEPAPKRIFCGKCGKELVNPDAKFCFHCGCIQEHTAE